ncbi:5947_t:CDS:2, partial [Ambispora leptoticha]
QATTKTKTTATNTNNNIITNPLINDLVLDSSSKGKSTTKKSKPPMVSHYAPHRHVYATKAIEEFDAVNQEYLEWCAQITNTGNNHNGNNLNISGMVGSGGSNGGIPY